MRNFKTIWAPILGFALLAACSSDESGGGGGGPFAPPGNGVPMGEKAACDALQSAVYDRGAALACGPITLPACPGYLVKANESCLQYDQGTVQGCAGYIGGLGCAELQSYQCIVKSLPGTAPNGCPPPVDAGADTGVDAPVDAPPDAPEDAPIDVPVDVAVDAPLDAGSDAASDAQPD
jgi:hypothetical protein